MSSVYGALIGFALMLGALLLALFQSDPTALWQLSRSAGLVAYTMLWGSTAWGLLLSTRVGSELARPAHLMEAHQFLSQLAIGFTLFHALAMAGNQHLDLSLLNLLAPVSELRPLVALGQLALWLCVLLMVSHSLRKRLGNRWWRRLHYAAFLAFGAAAVHALALGSSSGQPVMRSFYLLTVGSVVVLTLYRILLREPARPGQKGRADGTRVHSAGGR